MNPKKSLEQLAKEYADKKWQKHDGILYGNCGEDFIAGWNAHASTPGMRWVKASDEPPDDWFRVRLRNIEQGVEITAKVIAVHPIEIEFDSGAKDVRITTYIQNIEWLDESASYPASREKELEAEIKSLKEELEATIQFYRTNP